MLRVTKLKAALAAVPATQPCTPAAVKALHTAGHGAAQHIAAVRRTPLASVQVLADCLTEEVPGACMPVLAWLAAGLCTGLPPAATQQAYEMACALMGVVTAMLPDRTRNEMGGTDRAAVGHLLQQLGKTEVLCQQLAQVVAALLATAFPGTPAGTSSSTTTTGTSSSSSSSMSNGGHTAAPSAEQQASLALMFDHLRLLLLALVDVVGMEPLVPALTGSGLYKVLLEGVLLLLGADPAAYPQTSEMQTQLWKSLTNTVQAGIFLTVELASGVLWLTVDDGPSSHPHPGTGGSNGSSRRPWMKPLFKLQVLLLAKMQWDVRQCPGNMSTTRTSCPWPGKALTRAVPKLRSPCVAGDLLRQRAPVLVPHTYPRRVQKQTLGARGWEVKEEILCTVPPHMVARSLEKVDKTWPCWEDSPDRPVPDALDLGLLMEVAELYCLVVPAGRDYAAYGGAWRALVSMLGGMVRAPYGHLPAAFAATCGEALISIAEYLTEDVLLVMAPDGPGAASSSSSRGAGETRAMDVAPSSASSAPSSTRSSSSRGSAHRPVAGGCNPAVTQDHRLNWAQDALDAMCLLLAEQQALQGHTGDGAGAAYRLLSDKTAPRLRLLLERIIRMPSMLQGARPPLDLLLPSCLSILHAAASSPAGSRALLSAATTLAKRQRVTNAALAALAGAGGALVPAVAQVKAAAPGPVGEALGQQLMEGPAEFTEAAYDMGWRLLQFVLELMGRGVALLDVSLGPAAAYLARQQPRGQDSQLEGLEGLLATCWQSASDGRKGRFPYLHLLFASPQQVESILQQLTAALQEWQYAAEVKRAAKLAEKMGGAAAAEELQQKLVGLWLEGGSNAVGTCKQQQVEGRQAISAAATSRGSMAVSCAPGELPCLLQRMCAAGYVQQGEVLAAHDSAQWAAAMEPPTSADWRVAATAVFMGCKVAGALAQLPHLLQQVQGAAAQQPWGEAMASGAVMDLCQLQENCNALAQWALLLAPVLGLVMPADQAAQLQEVPAGTNRSREGFVLLTPDAISRVLDLLGHVAAPGAPGCSYLACCNLEGRTEAELPLQACSKCHGARYCCREHQVAHWKAGHKEVCQAVQAAAKQMCDVAAGRSDQGGDSQ